jgi:hypothetical protein
MALDLDALSACVVLDEEGRELRVGELWNDRPVVLAWVRHFG